MGKPKHRENPTKRPQKPSLKLTNYTSKLGIGSDEVAPFDSSGRPMKILRGGLVQMIFLLKRWLQKKSVRATFRERVVSSFELKVLQVTHQKHIENTAS